MKPRGYLHGITSLTYGVDVQKIRLLNILQMSLTFTNQYLNTPQCLITIHLILINPLLHRIEIGYIAATLCEIWIPHQTYKKEPFFRVYIWHW
uniref:Uncharacterized protein n=1 Tax=Lactuca sativa TaxID=4236 RepID=A0A9R1WJD3_LACSA|nr:hypothetical protein LSAT_V11C200077830 [Lactuca sativa]